MTAKAPSTAKWVVAMILVIAIFRLACMAWLPLMDTTEARYAEIGRKMFASGDWITPWHDSLPFWGKPPLSFWLTTLSFSLFGVNEFASRLPHFLCLVLVAWMSWTMAAKRSRQEALVTIALLAGACLFFVSAGAVMTDEALVVGTTLAMRGFWFHLNRAEEARGWHQWQMFVGIAIGLLAKGPLAMVLVFLPIFAWLLATRRWADVWREFAWIRGMVLALFLAAPWYVAAEIKTPGFLEYFIAGEHWHRFVTPGWKGDLYGNAHRFPPGTIWLCAVAATMPWALMLPIAFARWRRLDGPAPRGDLAEPQWRLYLVCWSLAPLLFFTAARNIIWTYVLPALPAMALLASAWLQQRAKPESVNKLVASGLAVTLLGSLAFGAQLYRSDSVNRKSAKSLVAFWQAHGGGSAPLIFIGSRLHSASFYSDGQARLESTASAARSSLGGGRGFLAIEHGEVGVQDNREGRFVGRFGRYDLFEFGPGVTGATTR
ncbi:hypothetical protein ALISP_1891 [Alicycliphilus sp. B1]|nr:hypothetical protein ALISP_1891 [Alicycliphilus sp. B1]